MEQEKQQNREWVYVLIGIVCIIVTVIAIILYLLQGSTKTISGGEVELSESMACEGEGFFYPMFKYDNAKSKSIKINIMLNDDKIDTINLIYELGYDDAEQIKQSSAENHAAMNFSFEDDSLGPDALRAHYSNLEKASQMALYAEAKDLNGVTKKYFLLDGVNSLTKDNIAKKYNELGMNCEIKDKS